MKDKIINVARELAKERGVYNMTHAELGKKAGIPPGSFQHYMGVTFHAYVTTLLKDESLPKLVGVLGRNRADAEFRKRQILFVAVGLSKEDKFMTFTRMDVAREINISDALVTYHFGSMENLKKEVMAYSIKNEEYRVIAQGVLAKDKQALGISDELRHAAINDYINS